MTNLSAVILLVSSWDDPYDTRQTPDVPTRIVVLSGLVDGESLPTSSNGMGG